MKRTLLFFLVLTTVLCLGCTKDHTNEQVHRALAFPLESNCFFSLGELDGTAHLCLKDESLSLGITDGTLKGLVVSASEASTRFLYEGIDITFSAETTGKFTKLFDAMKFLTEQTFEKKNAVIIPDGLQFIFTDESGAQIEYSVNSTDFSAKKLLVSQGDQTLLIDFF